ncbi:MAG: MFS transporter [Rhizobiales bacterium NRL2]|nr:MAG: MFS transporter [Rhizobiales bacterium NRL2]
MSNSANGGTGPGRTEFVTMMALLTSMVALSIDTVLPALPVMGRDLGVADVTDNQLIVTVLFAGLGLGQLIYGPLSDSIGRKPAIYIGIAIFLAGCLASLFAPDFETMLVGRALQGLGAASARIVTIAVVRDRFAGRGMAQVMSFIMAVFILVPILAPMVGQGILFAGDWHLIFVFFIGLAGIAVTWFGLRQFETLPPARRVPFSLSNIARGFRTAATNRITLGYTIATGFTFGPFLAYLSSAQQIFQYQYGTGDAFALYFAGGAASLGVASFLNGRIVMRYGMRRLVRISQTASAATSFVMAAIALAMGVEPSLFWLMVYFMAIFFAVGMVFGNLNALAMEPMGAIAGIASAFVGFVPTALAVPQGILIGSQLDGSVIPLMIGFGICTTVSLGVGLWADRDHPPGPIVEPGAA